MSAPGTILLVEDDPDIRSMVGQLLELEGYRVLSTSNGVDGLELLRRGERPFLVLLDLMMPVMNGWEFIAEQARDESLVRIPVVVLTGNGRAAEQTAGTRIAGFLKKPIDLDVLLSTVERFAQAAQGKQAG